MDKEFTSLAKPLQSTPRSMGFEIMFLEKHSHKIRPAEGSCGGLLLLLVTSAVCVSRVSKLSADDFPDHHYLEIVDHPHLESKDLKTETCLKCHPAKNQEKFVHTAVGTGCQNCHRATNGDGKTKLTLVATGGDLCAKCHEIKKDPVLHGPYKAGKCLICHDPHTAPYPGQTRAAVNTLCLSCHMLNQPEVSVNAQIKTVTLLDGQALDLASWQSAPKISERHPNRNDVPLKQDGPVTSTASGKLDAQLSCLSCHDPHASKAEHLLHKMGDGTGAAANLPPRNRRNFMAANGISSEAAMLQGSLSGGLL
jgi:predicted CXXCH cytochrome family protein